MNRRLLSGHEVELVSQEEANGMDLEIHKHGLVRILPEGWLYSGTVPTFLDNIYKMKIESNDVLVLGFSKSGTTWMQEIVWTMVYNAKLDNPKMHDPISQRSPTISLDMMFDLKVMDSSAMESYIKEFDKLCPGKRKEDGICLQLGEATPSPRILKSVFPISLYPPEFLNKAKAVYIARNPKDVMVSLFNFFKMMNVSPNKGNIEDYCKAFINDKSMQCPYWPHVKQAWEIRHHPNMHFVTYESLKANIIQELQYINIFLGTRLTWQQLEGVAQHTSFSAMKSRGEPIKNHFFTNSKDEVKFYRKGMVGNWKNHFSPELQGETDEWIRKNLAGSDLSLTWAQGQ